jgi:feruloyl-CoA synthase
LVQQPQATREALNRDPLVRQRVAELLATHNAKHPGSSTRIARFHLLDEMPSIDLGEITDKGSINQRGVQRHRRPLVQALFAHVPGDDVVTVGAAAAGARRGAS